MAKVLNQWVVVVTAVVVLGTPLVEMAVHNSPPNQFIAGGGSKDPVSRANYGVLLTPIKTIYPASSVWMHVFTMPLPRWNGLGEIFKNERCDRPAGDDQIKLGQTSTMTRMLTKTNNCRMARNNTMQICIPGPTESSSTFQTSQPFQSTMDFKCIVSTRVLRQLHALKRGVLRRLKEAREEALKLVQTNSSNSEDDRRKRSAEGTRITLRKQRQRQNTEVKVELMEGLAQQISDLEADWTDTAINTEQVVKQMTDNTPEVPDKRRRSKRFFGNPFAWIGKSLFGLASNSDVKRLALAVQHLQKNQEGSLDQFKALKEDATSFMRLSNARVDGLRDAIQHVYQRLTVTAEAISQRTTANAQLLVFSVGAISKLLDKINLVQRQVDKFTNGLKALLWGQLSPDLISEEVLSKTIEDLQERLRRRYNVFHLTETNPLYYYRHAKVHHFRSPDGQRLYIAMTFPLSSLKKTFYLYSVNVHNAPLKQGSEFTSRLRTDVDYFGVTEDRRNFIELTQKELAQCEDTTAVRCTSAIQIFDVEHPTCMAAIFLDKTSKIDELCGFRFEKTQPMVEMTDVGGGQLLISNADFIILQCKADMPRQKDGCDYCRVEFMCGCSIYIANNVSNAAMPARLTNCRPERTVYPLQYPVNLAVLANVFDPAELEALKGDDLFDQEQIPELPPITVSDKFQVNINRDYAYSMDLKEVLNTAKSRRAISPISARPLASWKISSAEEFFTLPNVLAVLSLICSIGSIVYSWYTLRSLRILKVALKSAATSTAMEVVKSIPGSKAEVVEDSAEVGNLLTMFNDLKEQGEVMGVHSDDGGKAWETAGSWSSMIGFAGTVLLIGYLLWKLYRNRTHTSIKLCVELGSTSKTVSLLIMKLPGAPANYHIRTEGSPRVLAIMGKWRPRVAFDWGKLVLTDRLSGLDYVPPSVTHLNPIYLKRARSILEASHCLALKFVNGLEAQTVQKVCSLNCQGDTCREVFGGTPFRRTLYPKLSFDHLHETLRPMGTGTSAGGDDMATSHLLSAYSVPPIPTGPASDP